MTLTSARQIRPTLGSAVVVSLVRLAMVLGPASVAAISRKLGRWVLLADAVYHLTTFTRPTLFLA